MWLFWVILVGFFVLGFVAIFNSLVSLRARVKEAWSDIEVQLKRRHDLIPNLIETVKGYAAHEKGVFEKVTEARTRALSAHTPEETGNAERGLSGALKTLFAVAENYPVLRASENFQKLQEELSDTENKVQAARRFYNGNVRDFNIKQEVFPSNIVARMFAFKKAEFFEIEEEAEKEAPKVSF